MERVSITERPDWREYGFNFHTMYGEPYWSEEAYYKLTLAQVEKLEEVTAELHQMCLQVVEKVIASDELMTKFRIPKHTWGFVRQSWKTNQPSLYSRLDLAWDGVGEPKLLENNADTPTSLYEAAFFQWISAPCSICRTAPRKQAWRRNSSISKISVWAKKVSLPICRIR